MFDIKENQGVPINYIFSLAEYILYTVEILKS